jgi:hypothetical protein
MILAENACHANPSIFIWCDTWDFWCALTSMDMKLLPHFEVVAEALVCSLMLLPTWLLYVACAKAAGRHQRSQGASGMQQATKQAQQDQKIAALEAAQASFLTAENVCEAAGSCGFASQASCAGSYLFDHGRSSATNDDDSVWFGRASLSLVCVSAGMLCQ